MPQPVNYMYHGTCTKTLALLKKHIKSILVSIVVSFPLMLIISTRALLYIDKSLSGMSAFGSSNVKCMCNFNSVDFEKSEKKSEN